MIFNCRFENNASNAGGGVLFNNGRNNGNSSPIIANSVFVGNSSPTGGGVFYNWGDSDSGASGNNDVDGGTASRASFGSMAATDYFIYVTGNSVESGSFQLTVDCLEACPTDLVLDAAHSPLTGSFAAQNTITVTGEVQVNLGANVMLDAPEILLDPMVEVPLGAVLEANQAGCPE